MGEVRGPTGPQSRGAPPKAKELHQKPGVKQTDNKVSKNKVTPDVSSPTFLKREKKTELDFTAKQVKAKTAGLKGFFSGQVKTFINNIRKTGLT